MDQKQIHKTSNNRKITLSRQSGSHFSFLTMDFLLLFLLIIFVVIIYSSSIKGPFVFDDISSIQDNPQIRLTKLTLDGIIRAGFESPCKTRPLANISFALNYYFNRYDVAGYHVVNILLHIATATILFYFVKATLVLLSASNITFKSEKSTSSQSPISNEHLFISFFTAFIWLVHPLQTQSVSYVVQRMNCMSAMFYILSLLLYVRARLTSNKGKKLTLFLGCTVTGILSLGSKEIAATLPFFVFLYEWYFFQDLSLTWLKRNSIYLIGFLLVAMLLVFFYLGGHPIERILSSYSKRDFTLWQRVLTEFRVVIYYISLIIFPHPVRLNLLHDFSISRSFLDPVTTLLAFVTISGLLATAFWLAKKERLLSFCILWFLGNLVIESSVIALEIIFEHRNYLPSMLFIFAFVILAYRFVTSKRLLAVLLCTVAVIFSFWTYQRNIIWSDDVVLWQDCVKKSPHQPRQHYNLGVVLAHRGNLDDAIKHYRTAIKLKSDYLDAYYNLGNALARKGEAETAIFYYRKTLQLNPNFFKSYYNIARVLSNQGKTGESIRYYQKALIINSEMAESLYNLSWIYGTSENEKYRNGIKAVNLAEKLCTLTDYQQPLALDALAAAYAENGKFDKAVLVAQKALKLAFHTGPKELLQGLNTRRQLYQARQPYRQGLKQRNES